MGEGGSSICISGIQALVMVLGRNVGLIIAYLVLVHNRRRHQRDRLNDM